MQRRNTERPDSLVKIIKGGDSQVKIPMLNLGKIVD